MKHKDITPEDNDQPRTVNGSDSPSRYDTVHRYAVEMVSSYDPDTGAGWGKLQELIRKRRRRRIIRLTVPAAAAAVIAVIFTVLVNIPHRETFYSYDTKGQITLPDGSRVWINNNSKLTYGDQFGQVHRRVILEGEALFDVVRGDTPFTVNAGEMDVAVLGTIFNVEAYPSQSEYSVTLVRGSVSVSAGNASEKISPFTKAVLDRTSGIISLARADVLLETVWANPTLRIEDRPLGEICMYLEKWYNVKIEVAGDIPSHYRYTFTLEDEPLEEVLQLMARINSFGYTLDGDHVTITE